MYILGIDIGGTKCSVVLGHYIQKKESKKNEILIKDKIIFPTEVNKGPDYTIKKIFINLENLLKINGKKINDINRIGISCGGPLNSHDGIILDPPNLIGWHSIKIVDLFKNKYGIKTLLQNDANACALAEWQFGAAQGYKNVIFLTFGTGLGAGLILDGKLYSGTNDMAGELGHIRLSENGPVGYGKSGSFEGFCSGGGIAQLAKTKVLEQLQSGNEVLFCNNLDSIEKIDAKLIVEAAFNNDELAIDILKISGQYLGKGLSIIIDLLNPEIIVIGSVYTKSEKFLRPHMLRIIEKESVGRATSVCKICPAGLGDFLGDYAAMSVGLTGIGNVL